MRAQLHKFSASVLVLLLAVAMLAACDGADAGFDMSDNVVNPDEEVTPSSVGYISFGGLTVDVEVENEEFSATRSGGSTNGESVDIGDYIITITHDDSDKEIHRSTYAEAQLITDPLEVAVGNYTLNVTSKENIPATAWNEKVYSAEPKSLVVGDNKVTTIGDVECRLATIKTQVTLSADMKALFKKDDELEDGETKFLVTLTYGTASMEYSLDKLYDIDASDEQNDANTGYFAPQEGVTEIGVRLSGMYNQGSDIAPNYTPIDWTEKVTGVKAAQSRMISIKIDNYDSGNIQINLTVETWIYDKPLGINLLSGIFYAAKEDTLFDPDSEVTVDGAPVVSLANGLNIADVYTITEQTLDLDAETYSPIYKLLLAPEDGESVESIKVSVSSTSSKLMSQIADAGYDGYIDLWADGAANALLKDYMTITSTAITLKYNAIKLLYDCSGTHTFKLVAIDSQSRSSYTTLTMNVSSSAGPDIVWEGGYNFANRYEISQTTDLPVVITISTETGLTALSIKITSDVLDESLLGELDLATQMDLINPATDEMASMLSSLGFPVGSELKGVTTLPIDITEFMPALAMMGKGNTDFEITAGDSTGDRIETIRVVCNED